MKSTRRKPNAKKSNRKGRRITHRRGAGLFDRFKRKPTITPEQIAAQEQERQRMAQIESQRRQMAEAHFAERDKEKIKETGRELLEAAEKGERLPPTRQRYLREFKRYVSPLQTDTGEFDWPASIEVYKKMAETGVMPSK